MTRKKRKSKAKEKQSTLEELIVRSHVVRKNIDTIITAFKRIEKHMNEVQGNLNERRVRQQSMNIRLEQLIQLIKDTKELEESIKKHK